MSQLCEADATVTLIALISIRIKEVKNTSINHILLIGKRENTASTGVGRIRPTATTIEGLAGANRVEDASRSDQVPAAPRGTLRGAVLRFHAASLRTTRPVPPETITHTDSVGLRTRVKKFLNRLKNLHC